MTQKNYYYDAIDYYRKEARRIGTTPADRAFLDNVEKEYRNAVTLVNEKLSDEIADNIVRYVEFIRAGKYPAQKQTVPCIRCDTDFVFDNDTCIEIKRVNKETRDNYKVYVCPKCAPNTYVCSDCKCTLDIKTPCVQSIECGRLCVECASNRLQEYEVGF